MAVKPIPEARLELARLQSTDFKSVASTDSATQVYLIRIIEYLSFVNSMGSMRDDYTNPGYGFDRRGAPNLNNDPLMDVRTGYGSMQPPATLEGGFGRIMHHLYNDGYLSDENFIPKYTDRVINDGYSNMDDAYKTVPIPFRTPEINETAGQNADKPIPYTTPGAVLGAVTGSPFTVADEGGQATINPRGGFSVTGSNYGINLSPHNIGASYRTNDGKTQFTAGVSPLGGDNFGVNAGFTHNPKDPVSNRIVIEGLPNQGSNQTTSFDPENNPQDFLIMRMREQGVVPGGGTGGSTRLGAY